MVVAMESGLDLEGCEGQGLQEIFWE